jgi:acetyltransferase-like isoleucine patch superfamily enzyme
MRQLFNILRHTWFLLCKVINYILLTMAGVNPSRLKINGILIISNSGTIRIAPGCKINSSKFKNIIGGDTRSSIIVAKGATLQIGEGTRISNSAIQCSERISIGKHAMIGGSCRIWDSDFHSTDPEIRKNTPNEGFVTAKIKIGNNVFIGGGTIILKGSVIGDNTVLAAGSVVSGTIPANEIWGGNPAKFIKKLNTPV